ncbi:MULTISPECIES: hypothetical protein [Hungatella]|nr:hypothetical protein [Hungatella hathewayi]
MKKARDGIRTRELSSSDGSCLPFRRYHKLRHTVLQRSRHHLALTP